MSPGLRKLPVPAVLLANGFTRVHLVPWNASWQPGDIAGIFDFATTRGRWLHILDSEHLPRITTRAAQVVRGECVDVPWSSEVDPHGIPYRHVRIIRRAHGQAVDAAAAAFDAELSALLDGTLPPVHGQSSAR